LWYYLFSDFLAAPEKEKLTSRGAVEWNKKGREKWFIGWINSMERIHGTIAEKEKSWKSMDWMLSTWWAGRILVLKMFHVRSGLCSCVLFEQQYSGKWSSTSTELTEWGTKINRDVANSNDTWFKNFHPTSYHPELSTRMLSRNSVVNGTIFNAIVTQLLLKCG
jgi:hypothetical protein